MNQIENNPSFQTLVFTHRAEDIIPVFHSLQPVLTEITKPKTEQQTHTYIIDGNTYPFKDLIKQHFQGKWNPQTKQWIIQSTLPKQNILDTLSKLIINTITIQ